jgi:predicted O-methyltransferase YrrM
MRFGSLVDAAKTVSFGAVRLAVKDRQLARTFWSQSVRQYDESMGAGLKPNNPFEYIYEQGWASRAGPDDRVQLPVTLDTAGGTTLTELVVLATVTRVLQPRRVFEIGTFLGRTTCLFVLNAPEAADIVTLDLPLEVGSETVRREEYVDSDLELVEQRRVGRVLDELHLCGRYTQLLCDSRTLDPAPYRDSVELGFIDGAHALEYVRNDTEKMAAMMADRGLVLWHDYGGKGRFRDLTAYLDALSREIAMYRIPGTTLAWAPAHELRKIARRGQ